MEKLGGVVKGDRLITTPILLDRAQLGEAAAILGRGHAETPISEYQNRHFHHGSRPRRARSRSNFSPGSPII